jgi:hypothetical protein
VIAKKLINRNKSGKSLFPITFKQPFSSDFFNGFNKILGFLDPCPIFQTKMFWPFVPLSLKLNATKMAQKMEKNTVFKRV